MTIAAVVQTPARVRWSWLWSTRTDLLWNFLPFWLGFPLAAGLYATRGEALTPSNSPGWTVANLDVIALAWALYGPLVDGPHLWGTIARTYTDAEEWSQRRWLFLSSLLALAIGPALILLPYLINTVIALPAHTLDWGFQAWAWGFGTYAIFHINKQHWGFVCLYKRKNGDSDARESRIDAWFFHVAIWAPYIAMISAPWDPNVAATPLQTLVYNASHAVFLTFVIAYSIYQIAQWRVGRTRNGPKLAYMATVLALYYVTFACDPRLAAFWVLITSTGHCLQYHAVVWQYGIKKYGAKEPAARKLPNFIFDNLWLYAVLGLGYALITLQGPGARLFKETSASLLHSGMFSNLFHLGSEDGMALGVKIGAAFISGVRLHHFYVDSKIWRVSKSAALAKNLDLNAAPEPSRPNA